VGEGINIQNQNILNSSSDSTFNWAANASFSIEFWMGDSAASNVNEVIVGRNDPGIAPRSRLHWWVEVTANTGFATFTLLDNKRNGNCVTGKTFVADGNWHQWFLSEIVLETLITYMLRDNFTP